MTRYNPLAEALGLIAAGVMRVDFETGLVFQTVTTNLYTYERPVGMLRTNGYVAISLGARRSVLAHRLMWAAAHGAIDPALVINHKNGVKRDNRLCNLEAVTPAENIRHAYRTGLILSGEQHYACKLPDAAVPVVREMLADGQPAKDIAAHFDVSASLIGQIRRGERRFGGV